MLLKLAFAYFAFKLFKWVFFRPIWIVLLVLYFAGK